MENLLTAAQQYLHQTRFLIDYCPSAAVTSPLCHGFWIVVVLLPIAIASLFLIRFLVHGVAEIRAMKRLDKLKADRLIIADEEVLEKHKWKGLDSELQELDQSALSEKIRQSIKSQ